MGAIVLGESFPRPIYWRNSFLSVNIVNRTKTGEEGQKLMKERLDFYLYEEASS